MDAQTFQQKFIDNVTTGPVLHLLLEDLGHAVFKDAVEVAIYWHSPKWWQGTLEVGELRGLHNIDSGVDVPDLSDDDWTGGHSKRTRAADHESALLFNDDLEQEGFCLEGALAELIEQTEAKDGEEQKESLDELIRALNSLPVDGGDHSDASSGASSAASSSSGSAAGDSEQEPEAEAGVPNRASSWLVRRRALEVL